MKNQFEVKVLCGYKTWGKEPNVPSFCQVSCFFCTAILDAEGSCIWIA